MGVRGFGVARVPVGLLWNSIDDKTMLEGSASRVPKDSNRGPKEAQRRHLPHPFTPSSKVFPDYGRKGMSERSLLEPT